jgi:hypothetical protein
MPVGEAYTGEKAGVYAKLIAFSFKSGICLRRQGEKEQAQYQITNASFHGFWDLSGYLFCCNIN